MSPLSLHHNLPDNQLWHCGGVVFQSQSHKYIFNYIHILFFVLFKLLKIARIRATTISTSPKNGGNLISNIDRITTTPSVLLKNLFSLSGPPSPHHEPILGHPTTAQVSVVWALVHCLIIFSNDRKIVPTNDWWIIRKSYIFAIKIGTPLNLGGLGSEDTHKMVWSNQRFWWNQMVTRKKPWRVALRKLLISSKLWW